MAEGGYAIGLRSDRSQQRQRFSLAHELGHIILHRLSSKPNSWLLGVLNLMPDPGHRDSAIQDLSKSPIGRLIGSKKRRMVPRQGQGTNRGAEAPFLFAHELVSYLFLMVRIKSPYMPGTRLKTSLFLHHCMRRPGAMKDFEILGKTLGSTGNHKSSFFMS